MVSCSALYWSYLVARAGERSLWYLLLYNGCPCTIRRNGSRERPCFEASSRWSASSHSRLRDSWVSTRRHHPRRVIVFLLSFLPPCLFLLVGSFCERDTLTFPSRPREAVINILCWWCWWRPRIFWRSRRKRRGSVLSFDFIHFWLMELCHSCRSLLLFACLMRDMYLCFCENVFYYLLHLLFFSSCKIIEHFPKVWSKIHFFDSLWFSFDDRWSCWTTTFVDRVRKLMRAIARGWYGKVLDFARPQCERLSTKDELVTGNWCSVTNITTGVMDVVLLVAHDKPPEWMHFSRV